MNHRWNASLGNFFSKKDMQKQVRRCTKPIWTGVKTKYDPFPRFMIHFEKIRSIIRIYDPFSRNTIHFKNL
jgi:hypothetical protein